MTSSFPVAYISSLFFSHGENNDFFCLVQYPIVVFAPTSVVSVTSVPEGSSHLTDGVGSPAGARQVSWKGRPSGTTCTPCADGCGSTASPDRGSMSAASTEHCQSQASTCRQTSNLVLHVSIVHLSQKEVER